MRVDTIAHQCAIRSWDGRTSWTWGSSCRAAGSAGVSIGSTDAIGGLGRLGRLGRVGMTAQARTLEEMLLLSRGILRADLLAVDTLDRETLDMRTTQNAGVLYVSDAWWWV